MQGLKPRARNKSIETRKTVLSGDANWRCPIMSLAWINGKGSSSWIWQQSTQTHTHRQTHTHTQTHTMTN